MIRRISSSYCGLQVVAANDDVTDRKISVMMIRSKDQSVMIMMFLIESSEYGDDDVAD